MIKKIFILISLFGIAISLFSQNKDFILKANLQTADRNGQKVYLQQMDYSTPSLITVIDSTVVVDKKFSFKSFVPEKNDIRIIEIGDNRNVSGNFYGFFVTEPGTITMTIDSTSHVSGNIENQKFQSFENKIFSYIEELKKMQQEYATISNSNEMTGEISQKFEEKGRSIMEQMNSLTYDFTKSNITNGIGEFFFIYQSAQFSPQQQKSLYNLLDPAIKETDMIKTMAYRNGWLGEKFSVGQKFEGIELMTLNGNNENVSNYIGKGKVVLIDFWASWCAPCRKDMPNVVSLYEKYKDRGFEIVGISLDNDEDSWRNGVSAMNMTWPQFSDFEGWKGKAASTYGVNRIPMTFLVDKNGVIVATDLRDNDLELKIEELLTTN